MAKEEAGKKGKSAGVDAKSAKPAEGAKAAGKSVERESAEAIAKKKALVKKGAGKKARVEKAVAEKVAAGKDMVKKMPVGLIVGLVCAAVLFLVLVIATVSVVGGTRKLPRMSISGEEASDWQKDGKMIKASKEIETTCTIANRKLDENLRPMVGEDAGSFKLDAGKYGIYASLECIAKVEGDYDEYNKGAKLSLETNEGDFELTTGVNKFTLTRTYRIFADSTGAPSDVSYKTVLVLRNDEGKTLSEYDLAIKVSLSEEDKKFIADWKKKIDDRIAQREREEKERAEREAAAREYALNNPITPDYIDLFRNWGAYKGKYIRITGSILQTDSSNSFCRVATEVYRKSASTYAGKYRYSADDVIYVSPCNPGTTKLLEDDVITVVGESVGNYTYETVRGGSVEIPRIKGMRFWLLDHIE